MFIRTLRSWLLLAARNRWLLITLSGKVDKLMSTFADVKATLEAIQAGVDGLEKSIADLKVQVAQGHVITQEELDSLGTQASAIVTDIADTSDQG